MIIGIIIISILVLLLIISFVIYMFVFHSPDKIQNNIYNIPKEEQYQVRKDEMLSMIGRLAKYEYEEVTTYSYDKKKLVGKLYKHDDNAPIALCFHGYRGNGIRDYSGGAILLMEMGFNVILVDQRAHGKSEGHTITFGEKEKKDVISWINYCLEAYGNDSIIYLYGISMGATTVLLSANLSLPENVKAIVADCPYNSTKDIIASVGKSNHIPTWFALFFTYIGALLFGHFNMLKCNVSKSIQNVKIPILIIHGEDDRFVPEYMSKEIYEANKDHISRITFPEAGHGISFIIDKERYSKEIKAFIDKTKISA